VDVYVGRIREKIEETPETPRYLKTLRGAGYRFEFPKTREPEPEMSGSRG
jgi:two-component system phosphate regulon response regulator PhoB